MPLFYVLALVFAAGATWLGISASDASDELAAVQAANAQLELDITQLKAKKAELQKVEPGALRPSPEALSVFYSRMLEAGEVLGAGMRIESRAAEMGQTKLLFEDPGDGSVGIEVCRARMQAAIEGDDAVPVLAMVEEELADLPVTVRSVTARRAGGDMALALDVDVFGRTQP